MIQPIDDQALDQVFRTARTHPRWLERPVTDEELHAVYELASLAPTSMNCLPARFVFLRTPEAKERLVPALIPENVDKARQAPVTAIVAYDSRFYELMSELWPQMPDMQAHFAEDPGLAQTTALRNGTLQGAWLILAARALGLDTGPMSGFDNAMVDKEFFPDGRYRSNFLVNLGHGDAAALNPRGPRLSFERAVTLL
jgi:3-hydroxypropanoate dehydrogenase